MKTSEEMNIYVQPDCKVCQIDIEQMIATSGTSATQNEEYETGDTISWY